MPLTSRAKKHSVVIQCVTRTTAECRGAVVVAGTAAARLGSQAESAIEGWYHSRPPMWWTGKQGKTNRVSGWPTILPELS